MICTKEKSSLINRRIYLNISDKKSYFTIKENSFSLSRTKDGVIKIFSQDEVGFYTALGFAHAIDRIGQMLIMRMVVEGRLSEYLNSDSSSLEIDLFMRNLGLLSSSTHEMKNLDPKTKINLLAYCDGVNSFLKKYGTPLEFKLLGHRAAPWELKDSLMILKLMSYLGLAQTQQDMEKFIIHAVKNQVDINKLKSLFFPHLEKLDNKVIELIKKVKIARPFIPDAVKFCPYIPKMSSSNNWVISPQKSKSNSCLAAHDPHLEVNRLPAVWYEFVGHQTTNSNEFLMGITLPGLPGLLMGRNQNVSMSFTYGHMDMIDYFVEEIKDGKYRREDQFIPLLKKNEILRRKGKNSLSVTIFETDAGILETDPLSHKIEDGFYLTRSWSCHKNGVAQTLDALFTFARVKNVEEAQKTARTISFSGNWVFSDKNGDIAFQQSGLLPKKIHSGLYPLPAWEKGNLWNGFYDSNVLLSEKNPKEGFLSSANNNLNPKNGPLVINLHQGHYRHHRIRQLLNEKEKLSIEDMKRIQKDLKSLQAKIFLKKLKDYLPENELGKQLKSWDFCYHKNSKEASLFENFYNKLIKKVFGHFFMGEKVWDYFSDKTTLFMDFFSIFDRILLEEEYEVSKLWFGNKTRTEFMGELLEKTILETKPKELKRWGLLRTVMMTNIFFDGNIPKLLGFDFGPIELEGNRATIVQGGISENHGRSTTCCPSYRFITDLNSSMAFTIIAGGPRDRRFSPHYMNDIKKWLSYKYKTIEANQENKMYSIMDQSRMTH